MCSFDCGMVLKVFYLSLIHFIAYITSCYMLQISLEWSKFHPDNKPNMTGPSRWKLQQRSHLPAIHSIYLKEIKYGSNSYLKLQKQLNTFVYPVKCCSYCTTIVSSMIQANTLAYLSPFRIDIAVPLLSFVLYVLRMIQYTKYWISHHRFINEQ